jgi:FG-GAP repeat
VSGSTIVAGAPGQDNDKGAVYVFTMPTSGGWVNATQTAELTASNGAADDDLGSSVAVSGSTIVAGADNHNDGAVYEWTMPGGGWSGTTADPMPQTAELTASDGAGNDELGRSVAVSGSTIVAGAWGHKVGANTYQGAVYEWTMPNGGWSGTTTDPLPQTAELTASDGGENDYLGYSVAVSGSTIVAGAYGHNSKQGAVYEWTMPVGGWSGTTTDPLQQTAELTASNGAAHDELGDSVAESQDGTTIVAGAPEANNDEGAAYVYTMPAGGWSGTTIDPLQQTAELTASDGSSLDSLGESVGVDGSAIVAGAGAHDGGQGAVYLWTLPDSGGWADAHQTAELDASDGAAEDQLGLSVAVSGSTIVGGAESHVVNSNAAGAAYEYSCAICGPAPPWSTATELTQPMGASSNSDADLESVACPSQGNCTALGEYYETGGGHAPMVASESGGTWAQGSQLALPSGGNTTAEGASNM